MRALRLGWSALLRDLRAGELRVLGGSLLLAVAASSALALFATRLERAMDRQAGELLAGDLQLRSPQPIAARYFERAAALGLASARVCTFPSVVQHGEDQTLVLVHAVSNAYPLRGRVRLAAAPFAPSHEVKTGSPAPGQVWLDARSFSPLNIRIGETVRVGASRMKLASAISYYPDQGSRLLDLAPALFMRASDVSATRLLQPGSRASYSALFAGEPSALDRFEAELRRDRDAPRALRASSAGSELSYTRTRAGRFFELSALATVMLAACAVAIAARRHANRRLDLAALHKSLGASQALVLQIAVCELGCLTILSVLLGCALGYVTQGGLALIIERMFRDRLPQPTLWAASAGCFTAGSIALGFGLPPLVQLRAVPPARVLRRELSPPPLRAAVLYGSALLAWLALLFASTRDAALLGAVVAAVLGAATLLGAGAYGLVAPLGLLRRSVGVALRYGLANIARRRAQSVVSCVAFGIGLTVLLLALRVRTDLLEQWRSSLPRDAPNQFLMNVRADQIADIQRFLRERGLPAPSFAAMIRGRLVAINGVPVSRIALRSERGREFLEREANLSTARALPPGNRVEAGSWWRQDDTAQVRASVESQVAHALELKLGDQLTYDVAGETVRARVTSFRRVRWQTLTPNFFIVLSPGSLDQLVGTYIASLYVPAAKRRQFAELGQRFPEVSALDLEGLFAQWRSVLDRVALAVESTFGLTLLAAICVLFATVQSTHDERRYESAILRTLGASRRTVWLAVLAEFGALGLVAGVLASASASCAAYFISRHLFDLRPAFDAWIWLMGPALGLLLVGVSGSLATHSVVDRPVIESLRSSD